METGKMKIVYSITERGSRSCWTRVGTGHVNRDGSLSIQLDAFPVNGTLHVRDWTPGSPEPALRTNAGDPPVKP